MTIKKISLALFSTCLIFLNNCKRREPVPPDPCEGKNLPSANFILAEKLESEERYFETDKINYVRELQLRGPNGYDEYLWQVGTTPNWSTKQNAVVKFDKAEGMLKVRLIAKRRPMAECFAGDDGIDTIDKWIDVIENTNGNIWNSPLIGYWEGASTKTKDSIYTIWFASKDSLTGGGPWRHYLYNLINCTSDRRTFAGYIVWEGQAAYTDCVFNYVAYAFPNNKDSIVVEYTVEGPFPDFKKNSYIFIGKRK
ncbi:MAG TPA: hypothetical protein VEC12_15820 [Bacteroidia bacterium]|nr:hypothetical protein [Bacteroidia bacterium]